jgi:hypothetical protein
MVLGRERAAACDDFPFDSRCSQDACRIEEDEMKVPLFKICELSFFFAGLSIAQAQQSIGTVGVQDATVAGALEVSNGRAILVGNTTVTARDRTAEIALNRGGSVKVCATSGLHVTAGKGAEGTAGTPLMLALDRGAIEVQMAATTRDVVMTPDLRFTVRGDGPLDLELRVTRNGDTCVDNRGAQAPVLNVADQFGEAAYELRAGQHVLFEHGSLKEVVDHESSSCGCPPEATTSVADALLHPAGSGATGDAATAAKPAAEEHPFPAAVSAGLAPPSAVPPAPAGTPHTQVSAALSSNEGADSLSAPKPPEKTPANASAATTPATGAVPATAGAPAVGDSTSAPAVGSTTSAPTAPAGQPEAKHDLVHVVGRFFKRLFGGG